MSYKKRSIISGILYLSLAFIGPFAFLIVPEQFSLAQDMNQFAADNLGLLSVWLVLDIVIIIIEVILTIYLWKLFNYFNEQLSWIAFLLRMIMVVVMVVNAVFLLVLLINGGNMADTYVVYHNQGVYIWQLFFSGHVFLLGWMVQQYITTKWKYLGYIMLGGALGYLVDSMNNLFSVEANVMIVLGMILLVFVTIGELGMAVALLLNKVIPTEVEDKTV